MLAQQGPDSRPCAGDNPCRQGNEPAELVGMMVAGIPPIATIWYRFFAFSMQSIMIRTAVAPGRHDAGPLIARCIWSLGT